MSLLGRVQQMPTTASIISQHIWLGIALVGGSLLFVAS